MDPRHTRLEWPRASLFWTFMAPLYSMRQGLCNGTVSVRLSVCLPQLSTGAASRAADLLLWAIEVTKRRHLAYARVDCNGDLLLRMNTRVDKQHDSWSTTHHRRVYVHCRHGRCHELSVT